MGHGVFKKKKTKIKMVIEGKGWLLSRGPSQGRWPHHTMTC